MLMGGQVGLGKPVNPGPSVMKMVGQVGLGKRVNL
jgi:hypothetical protein